MIGNIDLHPVCIWIEIVVEKEDRRFMSEAEENEMSWEICIEIDSLRSHPIVVGCSALTRFLLFSLKHQARRLLGCEFIGNSGRLYCFLFCLAIQLWTF